MDTPRKKIIYTKKTRLIDLFDQLSLIPQTPMSILDHGSQSETTNHIQIHIDTTNTDPQDSFLDLEQGHEEDDDGEIFGVILSKSQYSNLSTSCHGLRACKQNSPLESLVRKTYSMRAEKQNSVLESAVRRALSLRATPMVSEAYHRIDDDQYDLVADDQENLITPQTASNKKRNKIFEVCRRLFGF